MKEVRILQLPRITLVLLAVFWGFWVSIHAIYNGTLTVYDSFSFCCVVTYFVGIYYPRASSYIYCFFCFPVIATIGILSYCLGHYAEHAHTVLLTVYVLILVLCIALELIDAAIAFMVEAMPAALRVSPSLRRLINYVIPVRRHGYASDVNIMYDEITIQLVNKLVVVFRSIGLKVQTTRCNDFTQECHFESVFESSMPTLFVTAESYVSKHCKVIVNVIEKEVVSGNLSRNDIVFLFCNCDVKHILAPVILQIYEVRAIMFSCDLADAVDIDMNLYEYQGILLKWAVAHRELQRVFVMCYRLWFILRYPIIYFERPIELFDRPINVPQIEY